MHHRDTRTTRWRDTPPKPVTAGVKTCGVKTSGVKICLKPFPRIIRRHRSMSFLERRTTTGGIARFDRSEKCRSSARASLLQKPPWFATALLTPDRSSVTTALMETTLMDVSLRLRFTALESAFDRI
jgi:hypothetical protein